MRKMTYVSIAELLINISAGWFFLFFAGTAVASGSFSIIKNIFFGVGYFALAVFIRRFYGS